METIINEIKDINKSKKLRFCEKGYFSKDEKTIMGEVAFKEILFLDYRDTEAGSNPREYCGLKKTNSIIIKSLLEHSEMFRFLHSGIIVSLSAPTINNEDYSIIYDDCCLTNGNQTRFIILIITLLKLFAGGSELGSINNKEYSNFIKKKFGDTETILSFLSSIKFSKIIQIANFLVNNDKYLKRFNEIDINDFLNTKIRIQINLLDSIIDDLKETKLDNYSIGSLIAEANNDTQNVKVDDIFGNKYKKDLGAYIFNRFLKEYEKISIEYRMGEVIDKDKVHILTLLRPVVALGILTKEKDIYEYTNQRAPVYRLFEKLLWSKGKVENTVETISKLIPLLYSIRINYVIPQLEIQKRNFSREYTVKAINGELGGTLISKQIALTKSNEKLVKKIVEKNINYNVEHIMPVLVYRVRKLFKESNLGDKAELVVTDENTANILKGLIEAIYRGYIDLKLQGLPTSLTTVVRSSELYKKGEETYIAFKSAFNFEETDYIERNKYIIR